MKKSGKVKKHRMLKEKMLTCKIYKLLPNNNKYHLGKGCVCEPSKVVNLCERCE